MENRICCRCHKDVARGNTYNSVCNKCFWEKRNETKRRCNRYPKAILSRSRYQKSDKGKEGTRKWRQSNKGKYSIRNGYLKSQYGFTLCDWMRLLERQKYCCAICQDSLSGVPGNFVHTDHDHATKRVRGILCADCNNKIVPRIEKDPTFAGRLAEYVK